MMGRGRVGGEVTFLGALVEQVDLQSGGVALPCGH